jgi:hypothetical protein
MLLRIDLGEVGGVLLHEVEVGRCNDPSIVLERRVVSDVINAESGPSAQEFAMIADIGGSHFRLF